MRDITIFLTLFLTFFFLNSADGFTKKKKTVSVPCQSCEGLDGFIDPEGIDDIIRKMVGKFKNKGNFLIRNSICAI